MVIDVQNHETFIHTPVDRVWELLTQAKYIEQWYAFNGATIALQPGGEITFQWDEHGKYHGVVEEVTPNERFVFRYVPFEADAKPMDKNTLLVTITLQSGNDGTKVQLKEEGYIGLNMSDDKKSENFTTNQGAWQNSLTLLKELAEKEDV